MVFGAAELEWIPTMSSKKVATTYTLGGSANP